MNYFDKFQFDMLFVKTYTSLYFWSKLQRGDNL